VKLSVEVVLNAKTEKIETIDRNKIKVWVNVRPIENEANLRLITMLSEYYKLVKSDVKISHGLKSRNKIVEIAG